MSVRFFIFLIFSSQSCRCVFIFRSASTSFRLSSFLLRPRERLTQAAFAKEFRLKYCGIPRLCRNLWKVAATIFGEIGTVLGMAASLSTFAKEKTARTETNLKRRKKPHLQTKRRFFSNLLYLWCHQSEPSLCHCPDKSIHSRKEGQILYSKSLDLTNSRAAVQQ